jgi:tRNA (guanine37-N1)-methyltransferase
LGNEASSQNESFAALLGSEELAPAKNASRSFAERSGPQRARLLLDFPHYTRPAEYRGWAVPEVLVGGNHAEVAKWRAAAALEKTLRNRPDLAGKD